jgi:hypothetical protein
MMMSALFLTNTLSWIFIVQTHWNNSPQVEMLFHSDTLFWLRTNLSLSNYLFFGVVSKYSWLAVQEIPVNILVTEIVVYRQMSNFSAILWWEQVTFWWWWCPLCSYWTVHWCQCQTINTYSRFSVLYNLHPVYLTSHIHVCVMLKYSSIVVQEQSVKVQFSD